MGKGSGRRPTLVTDAEFQANYDRTFRTPQEEKPAPCPSIHETPSGYRVRCSLPAGHLSGQHGVEFDGDWVVWGEINDEWYKEF